MAIAPGIFSFDVFLSYNRAQKNWVRNLARCLRDDGFDVWFDEWEMPKNAGRNWIDLAAEGIEQSRKVVLVWSPEFFNSDWPQFESCVIQQIDPLGMKDRIIPLMHTVAGVPKKWGFREALDFTQGELGQAEFAFRYHQLVYNLDQRRAYEPDFERFKQMFEKSNSQPSRTPLPDCSSNISRISHDPCFAARQQEVKQLHDSPAVRRHWPFVLVIMLGLFMLGLLVERSSAARFYNNRGVQLQQSGQLKAAIDNYERAIILSPSYAAAHYNLADSYEEAGDYEKALQQYRSAIDVDPSFYPAYNNLSRLYILRFKDYGAALRLLERAISLKPKEASVQYSLYKNYGWATFEMSRLTSAEQNLKLATSLQPEMGAAHCLLAKVRDAQGRIKDALAEWELCTAGSGQPGVEPEWRNEAQERLNKEL